MLSRPSLVGRPCFHFSFSSFFETSSFAIQFYHMSLFLFPGSRDSATPWKTDPNLSLRLRSDNSQTLSLGTLCQDDAYRAPNPRRPITLAKCLSGAGVERFRLPHSPTIPQWAPPSDIVRQATATTLQRRHANPQAPRTARISTKSLSLHDAYLSALLSQRQIFLPTPEVTRSSSVTKMLLRSAPHSARRKQFHNFGHHRVLRRAASRRA